MGEIALQMGRGGMRSAVRLGLVGVGKIARDQHLPALAANLDFNLLSIASRNAAIDGLPSYPDLDVMLAGGHELNAISICTPPHGRFEIARIAIAAGLHVMLEKPPGATVAEVVDLAQRADVANVTLFATWHSREAAGVDSARGWLADKQVRAVKIDWREDIRVWHPGQDWILEAGGFGVFDPGINALSIATEILPEALIVEAADLGVPEGRGAPLTAALVLRHGAARVRAEFDFLQTGPQLWDITVETDAGTLALQDGGKRLSIDGAELLCDGPGEYPRLYSRFADLIAARKCDVDLRPLQLVADAFLLGSRKSLPLFEWTVPG